MEGLDGVTEQVERLVRDSLKTTTLEAKQEPSGCYYLIGPDGRATFTRAEAPRHREQLRDHLELITWAKWAETNCPIAVYDSPAIFVNEQEIVLAYSSRERRDFVVIPMALSPQYLWLRDKAVEWMKQRSLVSLLRITFRGCVMNENLLALVRALKFETGAQGEAVIQHGRESMGRAITQKVLGTDALPEEFGLNIPVFENIQIRWQIHCALEIEPSAEAFKVSPYPVECTNAMNGVLEHIRQELVSALPSIPVYLGRPFAT